MLDKTELNQLYRYALSLTNNKDQAYDVLQISVEKYLRANTQAVEKKLAYMKRIIRNEFVDQTRRNRFYQDIEPEALNRVNDERSLTTLTLEDVFVQQSEVESLLASMKPEERALLYLWAVEEFTIDEIAKSQQLPKGTVLSKLHRFKKRIQQQSAYHNIVSLKVKS